MPLTILTSDVENITKLDDNPTQQAGMTPAILKSRFDKGAVDIKSFINGTLIPELTSSLADKLSAAELTAAAQAILASAQSSGIFDGNGIASITLLSGSHAPGTTDTYRFTFTDNTACDFTVYNGADGLDGEVTKSTKAEETLASTSWTGSAAPYSYVYSNANITSTNPVELLPSTTITAAQLEALQGANIVGGTQAAGSITLLAYGDKPTIDIPVIFIFRRDL